MAGICVPRTNFFATSSRTAACAREIASTFATLSEAGACLLADRAEILRFILRSDLAAFAEESLWRVLNRGIPISSRPAKKYSADCDTLADVLSGFGRSYRDANCLVRICIYMIVCIPILLIHKIRPKNQDF
ncbi:hypothetical protein D9O50_04645 [Oxalobacteraceae bacterium CAVE-383]|nr:hypothetical protein D9O50_04645 [Oxalobacteraceae bacterium CAVE-383]